MLLLCMLETAKDLKLNFMMYSFSAFDKAGLLIRLKKIEVELEKVRGVSPLTEGWQTMKLAKKQRKWDELGKEKFEILKTLYEYDEIF
jgi:predicted secreted hydrolase